MKTIVETGQVYRDKGDKKRDVRMRVESHYFDAKRRVVCVCGVTIDGVAQEKRTSILAERLAGSGYELVSGPGAIDPASPGRQIAAALLAGLADFDARRAARGKAPEPAAAAPSPEAALRAALAPFAAFAAYYDRREGLRQESDDSVVFNYASGNSEGMLTVGMFRVAREALAGPAPAREPYEAPAVVADAEPLTFVYTNHRGETATRRVLPLRVWHGKVDEYYPEPTWLLHALDLDRGAERDFALDRISPPGARGG